MSPVASPAAAEPHPHAPDPGQFQQFIALADHEQAHGRYETAVRLYRLALAMDPDNLTIQSRFTRALFCLEMWPQAWAMFHKVRFRLMGSAPSVTRRTPSGENVPLPFWGGGTAPKRLLVMTEQGLGDTIQFARFIPTLVARGITPALVAPERLFPLLETLPVPVTLLPAERSQSAGKIDAWTNLVDLPAVLGLKPEDYGAPEPYLRADPARVATWREKLGSHGRLIGIQWRGNPAAPVDQARSATLADFAPLAEIPGVRLICLQKDATADEIAAVPFADRIEYLGDSLDADAGAFLDTAAILECCERVVAVDTAIVHLAGALGRPVDVLLQPHWADWRWTNRETDTLWYPTMRLWRRAAHESWHDVAARAAAHLSAIDASPAPRLPSAPTSVGDLIDRLTILDLKAERITDPDKRAHAEAERAVLSRVLVDLALEEDAIAPLVTELAEVNATLWDVEDSLRRHEARGDFGGTFVRLARLVYQTNDRRAALKRAINLATGSGLVEVKSYAETAEKADHGPQHRRKKSKAA